MHKFLLLAFSTAILAQAHAQVGIGTTTPHPNAALEVSSSTKGIVLPRITTTARNAMTNPPGGMVIYNTTVDSFQFRDASGWRNLGAFGSWGLYGNANTNANSFLGTTDNASLRFRTNNTERMIIDSLGNIGIGTSNPHPSAVLDITSSTKGLLMPRMATDPVNPADGLLYFNTSSNSLKLYSAANNTWVSEIGGSVRLRDNSTNSSRFAVETYNNSPANASEIVLRTSRGTTSAPTGLTGSNQRIGELRMEGHDGTNFQQSAFIRAQTDGSVSAGVMPSRLEFAVTNGAGQSTIPLTVKSNGSVVVLGNSGVSPSAGNVANSTLDVYGTLGMSYSTTGATNTIVQLLNGGTFSPPTASSCPGRIYFIRNISTTANVTVNDVVNFAASSSASFSLTPAQGSIVIISNGTSWFRLR